MINFIDGTSIVESLNLFLDFENVFGLLVATMFQSTFAINSNNDMMELDEENDEREEVVETIDNVLDYVSEDLFDVESFNVARHSLAPQLSWAQRVASFARRTSLPPLTLDDVLRCQNHPLQCPLLKNSEKVTEKAIEMFDALLTIIRRKDSENDVVEETSKLLSLGAESAELKDELFMQLFKQTRANEDVDSRVLLWKVWLVVASTMPPSPAFQSLLFQHFKLVIHDVNETSEVQTLASRTQGSLKRSLRSGPRKHLPTQSEIDIAIYDRMKKTELVYFLDGAFREMMYEIATTVKDAVKQLSNEMGLKNFDGFSLFDQVGNPSDADHQLSLIYDHSYIADVLADFANDPCGRTHRLVFKKFIFQDSDSTIEENEFIRLVYIQVQQDYLLGNYPVKRDIAIQLCAFQLYAEYENNFPTAQNDISEAILRFTSKHVSLTGTKEAWEQSVRQAFDGLNCQSADEARMQFMHILGKLPYGGAHFFKIRRLEDPFSLFPIEALLGINKNGLHFFRSVPKEYLLSIDFEDILKIVYDKKTISIQRKIHGGTLYTYRFETRHGEEIGTALETYIRETTKQNAALRRKRKEEETLNTCDFGDGYYAHLAKMRSEIQSAKATIVEIERRNMMEAAEIDFMKAQVRETGQEIDEKRAAKNDIHARNSALLLEIAGLRALADALYMDPGTSTTIQNLDLDPFVQRQGQLQYLLSLNFEERKKIERQTAEMESRRNREISALKNQLEETLLFNQNILTPKDIQIATLVERIANLTAESNGFAQDIKRRRTEEEEILRLKQFKLNFEEIDRKRTAEIESQNRAIRKLERNVRKEIGSRKEEFNQLQDLKGKIRVFARVRPLSQRELSKNEQFALTFPTDRTISHSWKGDRRDYIFDGVLPAESTQNDAFQCMKDLIQSTIDGYNACIFAYGQTGSGKTYTIYGDDQNPGLTPLGINYLFKYLQSNVSSKTFVVTCSMLELYKDRLTDLFDESIAKKKIPKRSDSKSPRPSCSFVRRRSALPRTSDGSFQQLPRRLSDVTIPQRKLEIKEERREKGKTICVHGAVIKKADSAEDLLQKFASGKSYRHVAATQMNVASSRSHLIMTVYIESTDLHTSIQTKGKLTFIDLAGSERLKKSESEGTQKEEAMAINTSLSALGNVVSSLAEGNLHVPYRDNKLTMLMSDSIGGNSKTLMFVNISPSEASLDETKNSLQYATRIRKIENRVARKMERESERLHRRIHLWKSRKPNHDQVSKMIEEYI